jgi:hypothetical protein
LRQKPGFSLQSFLPQGGKKGFTLQSLAQRRKKMPGALLRKSAPGVFRERPCPVAGQGGKSV